VDGQIGIQKQTEKPAKKKRKVRNRNTPKGCFRSSLERRYKGSLPFLCRQQVRSSGHWNNNFNSNVI
jgi:hypothetical protein